MTTQPRIALIGECMIELQHRADGSLQQSFGGDTLNAAVYLRRNAKSPPKWAFCVLQPKPEQVGCARRI